MNNSRNIVWGVILIVVGLILGMKTLNIVNINIFFDGWWTLFIIVPCFVDLFKEDNKTGSIIGIVIGVFLLLACQDVIDFGLIWRLLFPAILVIFGISCVFKSAITNKTVAKIRELNNNSKDNNEYYATFSSQKLDFDDEKFVSCNMSSVFGGITCDLRKAIIKDDAVITVTSVFGGVDIFVPDDVNVKVTSTAIFGGVDNKVKNNKDNKKTIYVNATCIFGGVEIK